MPPVHSIIDETIAQVLSQRGGDVPEKIHESDSLTRTLGLDSLDLAVVVVRLEQRLGLDPFRDGRPMVATVGELRALYPTAEADS